MSNFFLPIIYNLEKVFLIDSEKRECIPVGCVPPALYRTGGLCPGNLCLGCLWLRGSLSRGSLSRGSLSDPSPVDRQTRVNTLPYPKLRLRAVTNGNHPVHCSLNDQSTDHTARVDPLLK